MSDRSSLKSIIKTIPKKPGVYHFYDDNNKIIYIGKAKNLKRRVSSYFSKNHTRLKTKKLVSKIVDVKFHGFSREVNYFYSCLCKSIKII